MKNIILTIAVFIALTGCKYDDDYLNPTLETKAYFASKSEYTRTVIVGEGMQFKIGAAMSGVLENKNNETVDMIIDKSADPGDGKVLMPDSYYNSSELSGTIKATIPTGDFLGYFTIKIDSLNFLNDPDALAGKYTLPVKITGTSLESINEELDNIKVSVSYMCTVDGYYLYQSTIKKEYNGAFVENVTKSEKYPNESDNSTFRLETQAPFTVRVTPAVNSFLNGVAFDLSVDGSSVTYSPVTGSAEVTSSGENKYDSKTRDFTLNYKYKGADSDTIYHISQDLIFRNRMIDGVNQTRDYLSYFNE